VESDQPQFTVNQRYPVYFPELRPFFLENANYFSTPIDLIYTRNIVHPEYGVRVTGKIAHTNLGFFAMTTAPARRRRKQIRSIAIAPKLPWAASRKIWRRVKCRIDLYRRRIRRGMEPHRGG